MRNVKFHFTAIAIICVVITVLYTLFAPPPPSKIDPDVQKGHFIEIYSATWGAECNSAIQQAIADRQSKPLEKDQNGVLIAPKPLNLVISNNVLTAVSNLCNGKVS
jgi:hypothetical protein